MMTESQGKQPLISVIVPVYNVAEYLPECVDSIINQTYKNLEIILVDDGSTDACPDICDEYAKRDSRIRVIHKKNGGLSDARNAGLDICTGEWIGFVDSDDYIARDMYEKLYASAVEVQADVSVCQSIKDKNGKLSYYKYKRETEVLSSMEEMINRMFCGGTQTISACLKLYRKTIFSNLRFPVGKTNEDAFLILSILEKISKMVIIPHALYYYRLRIGSITNVKSWNNNIWDTVLAYKHNISIIRTKYPNNLKEGICRLGWAYRTSIGLAIQTEDFENHMSEIKMYRDSFKKDFFEFLLNPFVGIRGKIDTILVVTMPLNVYAMIRKYFC